MAFWTSREMPLGLLATHRARPAPFFDLDAVEMRQQSVGQ
jgi:hypothetical protein